MDITTPAKENAAALAALTASRICHDLVNPIGAVANGIELLQLSVSGASEEMSLVSGAVRQAMARVNFMRIAFGATGAGQKLSVLTVRQNLADLSEDGRYLLHWFSDDEPDRAEVKRVFLAMLCLETALPIGGDITYDGVMLRASGPELRYDPDLWDPVIDGGAPCDLRGAQVQFALLPLELKATQRRLHVERDAKSITLTL